MNIAQQIMLQLHFVSHDMENVNAISRTPVKNAARVADDFSVNGTGKLRRFSSRIRKFLQAINTPEDPGDEFACRNRIVQRNVFSDPIELIERRFGPYYSCHFPIRSLAWACVKVLFSRIALSPFDSASNKASRRCMNS